MLATRPWIQLDRALAEMSALQRHLARELAQDLNAAPHRSPHSDVAFNLYDGEGALVLRARLPGVAREELAVELEGRVLTVRGERRVDAPEGFTPIRRERRSFSFRRRWQLSDQIDLDGIAAELTDGVLTLTLPRTEANEPRAIDVR